MRLVTIRGGVERFATSLHIGQVNRTSVEMMSRVLAVYLTDINYVFSQVRLYGIPSLSLFCYSVPNLEVILLSSHP
jgi:hypothetical protein